MCTQCLLNLHIMTYFYSLGIGALDGTADSSICNNHATLPSMRKIQISLLLFSLLYFVINRNSYYIFIYGTLDGRFR